MATILIIDDNETIRDGIAHVVRRMGHAPVCAASGAEGLQRFVEAPPDFVITDLKMDGMTGVEVLARIKEQDPDCPTMIITAFGSVETAVEAMKLGAFDFLIKPFAPEVVRLKVERALELGAARRDRARLTEENAYLRGEQAQSYGEIVGGSDAMRKVFAVVDRVAPTDTSVAIYGESGTGKELVAHAIHSRSRRKDKPFIKVNCAALVETLLESELFGHEKGAFTGAVRRKPGRFELADGGTLFLDEIGDISSSMQTRLLRVLQEKEFERVGGEQTVKVDVRVLTATHRDLGKEVADGRFREDLFYRLQVVPVSIPPLRDRRGDIAILAEHFVRKLAPRANPAVKTISQAALDQLMAYRFPGNVRELENVIEQALVFTDGTEVTPSALPEAVRAAGSKPALSPADLDLGSPDRALPDVLDDLERQLILKAYTRAQGVKTETARLLGVKTSALYYKLEKYGIV
ncbi:MAG: sigma-54 dependent transcriptional regulator [Polyangia bacterium]